MKTLEFRDGSLWLLDQTKLPSEASVIECRDYKQVCEAIMSLRIRGAPAIGCAAAFGVALAAASLAEAGQSMDGMRAALDEAMDALARTRPTAVNLSWALERMRKAIANCATDDPQALCERLLAEADQMLQEDEEANRRMGQHGAQLIPDRTRILTHCNTGSLATAAYGTALGVIQTAHQPGKKINVWVDETRPLLQGSRLTAWELQQLGIPFQVITDSMAAHFMSRGEVDLVMVGADRVVANGDTANKIGTYGLAVLAQAHEIPFYFVAPTSTIDLGIPSGAGIAIEERKPEEVTHVHGTRVAPEGTAARNPAFDVTPAHLITAIVTEGGIVRPPLSQGLTQVASEPLRPVESLRSALVEG